MNYKNYCNKRKEPLYVLHFPGTGLREYAFLAEANIERPIRISDELSIISIMTEDYFANSYLKKQCARNHILIYNPVVEERNWNNTKKISYILEAVDQIPTKYALILDGRDTILVHDLDNLFLKKFQMFQKGIVYNGTPVAFPDTVVENIQELLSISSKQKFLNAGVCVGEKEALKTFYKKAKEMMKHYPNNRSEQWILRMTKQQNPQLVTVDYENTLFRICHAYDTELKELDKHTIQFI